MKTPKVLFITPPSVPYSWVIKMLKNKKTSEGRKLEGNYNQTIAMPMGLLYLSAVLERDITGIDIKIIDFSKKSVEFSDIDGRFPTNLVEITRTWITEEIDENWIPDFVGISVLFSTAHRTTLEISGGIKTVFPETPIVIGGMHATNSVEKLLKCPSIDYICRGEAESIITELAIAFKNNHDPEKVIGVYGRKKFNKEFLTNFEKLKETSPLIDNLDEIPFPSWHLLPMNEYIKPSGRARKIDTISQDGEATIMTTRGCPFHCTFCASWTVHGRKMRYRTTQNIIDEISVLYNKYEIRSLVPEDDLFTVKKDRIIDLCRAVKKNFPDISFQFPNGLSVATLDDEVISEMINMGMTVATISIESGSNFFQRKIIKKNANLDRARKVVQSARDQGVLVRCYFVIGFPGETKEMMQETIDFAGSIAADWCVFNIASPLIGSEMFDQYYDTGHIDDSFNWDESFYHDRLFDTEEISADELVKLHHRANIKTNFFGNYNFRLGYYERLITLFNDIISSYPEHIVAHYCLGIAYKEMDDMKSYGKKIKDCEELLINSKDHYMTRKYFLDFFEDFVDLQHMHEICVKDNLNIQKNAIYSIADTPRKANVV